MHLATMPRAVKCTESTGVHSYGGAACFALRQMWQRADLLRSGRIGERLTAEQVRCL